MLNPFELRRRDPIGRWLLVSNHPDLVTAIRASGIDRREWRAVTIGGETPDVYWLPRAANWEIIERGRSE